MSEVQAKKRSVFQFRLRTLFAITTLLAVALSGLFYPSARVQELAAFFCYVASTTVLAASIAYYRGYRQAFCVGAILPIGSVAIAFLPWFCDVSNYRDLFGESVPTVFERPVNLITRDDFFLCLAIGGFTGLLAVFSRWLMVVCDRRPEESERTDG